ncbi:MAG: glycosyltransferase [Planctomycetes bacterium]|nr:glycosyltransferase [Planctomycetota bacterium]
MITAALNPGAEVRQTIESVLSQGYPSLEYIFVDGGSRPDSFAHMSPYLDRIDVLIREPDEGISDAWNKAIARAKGEIVGIINADDYLLPGALDAVATAFERHGASPIVHGAVIRIENGRHFRRRSTIPFWLMIRFGTPVFHPATFVPKAVYARIGGFDKRYPIAMDYDFILRAYIAGTPFVRVPLPLAGFRSGGVSDRKPLEGFRDVWASQLGNGFDPRIAGLLFGLKKFVRTMIRPLLSWAGSVMNRIARRVVDR